MILKNLSGEFKAGTSTAIIGPSGSGKTTLLNFICARMKESPSLAVNGNLYVNGHKVDSIKEMKHRFGYVMQYDIMFEDFTPTEQFENTARFSGVKDVKGNVNNVVNWFNLEKCKNTRVGGIFQRGLSGGEKKRASVGLEVVSDPSVIFMDEPTTGLDSKSALDVAKLIKLLAKGGRTIITTIHQPSTDILARFDRIICLCEGRMIYDGKPLEIPQYFTDLGYAPPAHTNPADHVMNIVNDDDIRIRELNKGNKVTEAEVRKEFEERLDQFSKAYNLNKPILNKQKCPDAEFEELKENPNRTSFIRASCILLVRFYTYFFRNYFTFIARLIQMVLFSIFIISLFFDLKDYRVDTPGAIQDKNGMVFCITGVICFAGLMSAITGAIPLLPMFKREYESRLYHPFTYYFIASLYDIPIQLILTFAYLGSGWYLIDVKPGLESFSKYFITCFLCNVSASGFGDIMAYSIQSIQLCIELFTVVAVPFYLLSGILARLKDVVFYLLAYSYLSFFRFGYQAGIYIEFGEEERQQYLAACRLRPPGCFEDECAVAIPGNIACDPFAVNDFYETDFAINLVYLAAQAVIFRVAAAIIFYVLSRDRSMPYEELPPKESFIVPADDGKESIRGKLTNFHTFLMFLDQKVKDKAGGSDTQGTSENNQNPKISIKKATRGSNGRGGASETETSLNNRAL